MRRFSLLMATRAAFVTLLLSFALTGLGQLAPAVLGQIAPLVLGAHQSAAAEGPPLAGIFAENFTPTRPAEPAPAVSFTDLAGQPRTLEDFKGKVVLLNFWATWCAPCVREMPSLDRVQAKLANEGLKVIALSMDRKGRELVAPFMKKLGLDDLQAFLDPRGKAARAFGVRGLPASYIIDAEGRLVGSLLGPAEWDQAEAVDLLRFYLKQLPGGDQQSAEQGD